MLGVTFGNKHSYNDWGIWLEDTHINPPLPKRYIVDVPARNGLLDLTPELTPTIRFENRTLTFTFRVKAGDWSTLMSQIYGQIHGQTLDVISDLDPQWHWHGCVTVDDFASDERTGVLVITVDADPFKLSNTESSYTVNGNGTITCEVDRMEISPAFEIEAPTTVIYGDSSYVIESTQTTEKTLSGDIVSFADGTANPVVDLTAKIEAVQDLHGYANPWAGGAGKNLASPLELGTVSESSAIGTTYANMQMSSTTRMRSINLIKIGVGNSCAISFDTTNYMVAFACFDSSGNYLGQSSGWKAFQTSNVTYTSGLAEYIALIVRRVDNGTMSSTDYTNMKLQLEIGTSFTTYEPYENICPISGWDKVNVNVTGKNLLVGGLTWGNIDATGADSGNTHNYIRTINYSRVKPSTTYYIHVNKVIDSGATQLYSIEYDEYKNIINRVQRASNNIQTEIYRGFITTSNTAYVRFFYYNSTVFDSYDDMKIWLTTEETTPYEPSGNTYTTSLGSTYYGGTLNVTTGELVVNMGYVDLGTLTWTYSNGTFISSEISDLKPAVNSSSKANVFSSDYVSILYADRYTSTGIVVIWAGSSAAKKIYVADTRYSDAATFTTAMSGVQFVYELDSPQTVQLTAEQVTTLKNQNNIWADSGEVEVTYIAQDFAGRKFYIPDLELTEGSHSLTIQGTGTTTVTYTNGRL